MSSNIIDRLFTSFEDLETAIHSARGALEKKGVAPKEVVERLNSYDGILIKQRRLADDLRHHMDLGNWNEVSRHVQLINALSAMIRDDARAILSSLALNSDTAEIDDTANFC